MRRRIDEDALACATAAFLLPVFVLLLIIGNAPESFLTSVFTQSTDIDILRSRFAAGRLFIPDAILDILTRRLYPSFIICFLIGGNLGKFLFRMFFYLRFGLLGFTMYHFCSGHVKIKRIWGCVIGLLYSLCAASLISSLDPQIMNVMIAAPVAASAVDSLMRNGRKKDFWLAVAAFTLFMTGGFNGIISGVLFILSTLWLFAGLIPGGKKWPVIKALLASLICDLTVIIPTLAAGMSYIDIAGEAKNSTATFKFFDLLCSLLDGAAVNVPAEGKFPALSMSVFILMFALLFFINRAIPHSAKFAGLVIILLLTTSCSWSLLNAILSVYGDTGAAAMTRFAVLTVQVFIMAAVSLRNARMLTRNGVFAAVFSVLALIVISNVSAASEVTRSMFTIWFSAASVIFWGAFLSMVLHEKEKSVDLFAMMAVAGMVLNLWYSFSVSGFEGKWDPLSVYRANTYSPAVTVRDPLPLYGSQPEYIMIRSDLRQNNEGKTFPELFNKLSQAAVADTVFTVADAFPVYLEGVTDRGNGNYMPYDHPGVEMLLRAENLNFDSPYYVFSSFDGRQVLTETYAGFESVSEFDGPYVKQLDRHCVALSLRQEGDSPSDLSVLSLWRGNESAMDSLRSRVMPMEGYEALLAGDDIDTGFVTVVTSVVYSSGYDISITGPEGRVSSETFSYAGKLAVTFNASGSYDYMVRIGASYVITIVTLSIWVLSSAIVVYNILKNRKTDRVVPNA